MTQLVGVLALMLSESLILPLKVTRYASALHGAVKNFQANSSYFGEMGTELSSSIHYLSF